jgi:endonuclease YncB( thermonuclease family)
MKMGDAGFVLAVLALAASPAAAGGDALPGPVAAQVVSVLDGDTLLVRARLWLDQHLEVRVRLGGIDTPELRGRCPRERRLAREARAFVEAAVAGADVALTDIRYGKFARRVVARVSAAGAADVSEGLLARGLARAYDGGRRPDWCGPPAHP